MDINMINPFDGNRPLWQNILLGAALLSVFSVGFGAAFLAVNFSKIFVKNPFRNVLPTPNTFANTTPKPIEQINKDNGVFNILLLGYGGGNHDGGVLTDSIIVVHVDTNKHKAAYISVPRDLWVQGNHKINAAGINGFANSGPVVQDVTDLPINYFVSVDFSGFTKIIDDVNGISVNVPKTFDDPFYPITGLENDTCGKTEDEINQLKAKYSGFDLEKQFTCRYEHLHFDAGQTSLDGTTALKFVRSRHGDSDFGRTLRQFSVLTGIENKLITFQSAGKTNDIINTLSQIVKTDLDAGAIKSLIQIFGDPKAYSLNQIQLSTDNVLSEGFASDGEYILYPKNGMFDYSAVKSYISANINK